MNPHGITDSPFLTSWAGAAHSHAPLTSTTIASRVPGWAHWASTRLHVHTTHRRSYHAINLPGQYYHPTEHSRPESAPHVEIPDSVLDTPDPWFPHRLAIVGNTLLFPQWIPTEVLCIKRALFPTVGTPIHTVVATLDEQAHAISGGYTRARDQLNTVYHTVGQMLVNNPEQLTETVSEPFTPADVAAAVPALGKHQVGFICAYNRQAMTRTFARRIGVWHLTVHGQPHAVVTTGRLTRNSVFHDPLYAPDNEAVSVQLLRTLLYTRLSGSTPQVMATPPTASRFRIAASRSGAATSTPSAAAALAFVTDYPHAVSGWQALTQWAEQKVPRLYITVTEQAFTHAFTTIASAAARAESVPHSAVGTVLPLAWNDGRLQRITYHHNRK